jgi:hypothetical protein
LRRFSQRRAYKKRIGLCSLEIKLLVEMNGNDQKAIFGPKPLDAKESNWVPTKSGAGFEVLFRFYGPEKPLFDKTWKLPDIELMKMPPDSSG